MSLVADEVRSNSQALRQLDLGSRLLDLLLVVLDLRLAQAGVGYIVGPRHREEVLGVQRLDLRLHEHGAQRISLPGLLVVLGELEEALLRVGTAAKRTKIRGHTTLVHLVWEDAIRRVHELHGTILGN